jgi:hypothetical protein
MTGVEHLTGGTVGSAPVPCRECMWWQTRPGSRPGDKERWMREVEDESGPWGKLYVDDGRVIGLIQYGPSARFARARHLPAGPPTRDAVLVTCAYLTDAQSPWVLQSLFLAAIGECRDRGLPWLEAFGYRYPPDAAFSSRFLGHRTIFPSDFLHDLGFHQQRSAGRVSLERLDLRAIAAAPEPGRLEKLRSRLAVVPASPAGVR